MRKTSPTSPSAQEREEKQPRHRSDAQIRHLLGQFHRMKDRYDDMNFTAPYLATITARTLIIHGDRDEFFPVGIPVEMYEAISQSYLWVIPKGDHIPIFGEHARQFQDVALAVLLGQWEK